MFTSLKKMKSKVLNHKVKCLKNDKSSKKMKPESPMSSLFLSNKIKLQLT